MLGQECHHARPLDACQTRGSVMSARTKRLVLAASLLAIVIAVLVLRRTATPPSTRTEVAAGPAPRAAPRLAAVPQTEARAFVEGTVRGRGGRPVGGAVVVAVGDAGRSSREGGPPLGALAQTSADGRFRLGPLPAGYQEIDAGAAGHLPAGRFVKLDEGQTVRDFDLVLQPGGVVLSGRVLDASGGPIPGARVRAQPGGGALQAMMFSGEPPRELPPPTEVGAVAVADGEGQYQLTAPPGFLAITAQADGYVPGRALLSMAGPKTHDFHLIPATTIAGRVVRKGTGQPVPGARIRARTASSTTEVEGAADGTFLIGPVDPGSYQLLASAGPLAGRLSTPVLARVATRVDGVVIEIDRARTVTGQVRRTGGQPVNGAQVDLYGLEMQATTRSDAGGAFRLEGVVAGSYSLRAVDHGVGATERRVTVADRDLEGVDLILDRTGTVSGRVVDDRGQPCPDVTVTLEIDSGDGEDAFDKEEARQAAGGRFSFGELPPGVVTLRAEGEPCGRGRLVVGKLGPGEKREVTLRLSTQGRHVRGTVRWKDGRPASGIELTGLNMRADDDRAQASTGADGRYQLGPYPTGALVMVTPEGTAVEPAGGKRTVRLDEGDATGVDFTLGRSGGEIRGVVLGPDGRPLAGAVVRAQSTGLVTGADGAFAFTGLPAGEHDLFAEYAGLPRGAARRVASGRTDVRISLRRGALLAGVVEGVSGRGAGLCWVMARPAGHNRDAVVARVVCGEGASFELPGLLAGTYDLTATTADGRAGALPQVALSEGQEKRGLRLPLATRLTVLGRIVDLESRRPLAGARIRVSEEHTSAEAITDAAGKFHLEGAFRGLRLDYNIEAPGYVKNHLQRSAPMSGETFDLGVIPLLAERKGPATGRAGIVLSQGDDGSFLVSEAIEDLPAARAGLRRGDVILAIDGHPLENTNLLTAVSMIRGQPGTPLTLDVRQPDAKPRRLRFVRG